MSREMVHAKLELLAAEAKVAAANYSGGKYWPGELTETLGRMEKLLREISAAIGPDR